MAGNRLVKHAAERVQVAPSIDASIGRGLLRAHVGQSSNSHAGSGQPLRPGSADRLSNAEIGEHGLASLEQNVLRLDVSMNDALLVGVAQGGQDVLP